MKIKLIICTALLGTVVSINAQTTVLAPNYKVIDIGWNGYGDYTKTLILLHEAYNGTLIDKNYAVGTIKAMRGAVGAGDRTDVAQINSSSAYSGITGSVISLSSHNLKWTLKTAIYNGKKYLALDVPYHPAYHTLGFQFVGWTYSTSENMKCVSYEVNGQPVNQGVLSNIQDFAPTMGEFHDVSDFIVNSNVGIGTTTPVNKLHISEASQTEFYGTDNQAPISNLNLQGTSSGRTIGQGPSLTFSFPANTDGSNVWAQARILATPDNASNYNAIGRLYLQVRGNYNPGIGGTWNWRTGLMIAGNGNVGIGTTSPQYILDVLGTIRAREIKVDLLGADFVFEPTYKLRTLGEVETFIKANKHLPDIAPAADMQTNGVSMGDMQAKLLQKVEELTLYVIELKKENEEIKKELNKVKKTNK